MLNLSFQQKNEQNPAHPIVICFEETHSARTAQLGKINKKFTGKISVLFNGKTVAQNVF